MIWFISDTHFFHGNIIQYASRPFVDHMEMNAKLMKNWNATVAPADIVIHGGDFMFGNPKYADDILERLNGEKILVRGNHDRTRCVNSPGWSETANKMTFEHDGYTFHIQHGPWGYELTKDAHLNDATTIWIHGHTHGYHGKIKHNQVDISVEAWDYTPIHIDTVIETWKQHLTSCRV